MSQSLHPQLAGERHMGLVPFSRSRSLGLERCLPLLCGSPPLKTRQGSQRNCNDQSHHRPYSDPLSQPLPDQSLLFAFGFSALSQGYAGPDKFLLGLTQMIYALDQPAFGFS